MPPTPFSQLDFIGLRSEVKDKVFGIQDRLMHVLLLSNHWPSNHMTTASRTLEWLHKGRQMDNTMAQCQWVRWAHSTAQASEIVSQRW